MNLFCSIALVLIAQAEAPPETPPAAAAPPAAQAGDQAGTAPAAPKKRVRPIDSPEAQAELARIQALPVEQQADAMKEFNAKYAEEPKRTSSKPAKIPEVRDFDKLAVADQAKFTAREFFDDLVAGNARGLVERSGVPFQLEDRRINGYDELFSEWLKNLRSKRTDLLTLYDIEILSPADMEKKYGKPPRRLESLPWKASNTFVAVANLSGHAAVAVLKQHGSGTGWVVVGYHD